MTDTQAIPGPWVAETEVCKDADAIEEHGLAVIAVLPEHERTPGATPTRGMVAWVHSGLGACATDEQAIDTARLIAAAPDLLAALRTIMTCDLTGFPGDVIAMCQKAVDKAWTQP